MMILSAQTGVIMDLPAIPFQYNLTVEGEYVMKMRSTQGGDR
jgi:hypothetical protein